MLRMRFYAGPPPQEEPDVWLRRAVWAATLLVFLTLMYHRAQHESVLPQTHLKLERLGD